VAQISEKIYISVPLAGACVCGAVGSHKHEGLFAEGNKLTPEIHLLPANLI
jgi:hypothetical protein